MKQFEITVELKNVEPACYRKIIVQGGVTFKFLHEVIQISMGWKNYHLYEFNCFNCLPIVAYQDEYSERDVILASNCIIEDYISTRHNIKYLYDFGDWWEHELKIIEISSSDFEIAKVIEAKGVCPPEDIGGHEGYKSYLKKFEVGTKEEIDELINWLKFQSYDPMETLNIEKKNEMIKALTDNITVRTPVLN